MTAVVPFDLILEMARLTFFDKLLRRKLNLLVSRRSVLLAPSISGGELGVGDGIMEEATTTGVGGNGGGVAADRDPKNTYLLDRFSFFFILSVLVG